MKKFFVLWISQAASLLGSSLVQFALAWYLASTTGKATILAISMLVGVLPQVVLGPFIGPFIDRWDRKRIMIISDLAVAGVTAVLVVLFWANAIQVWHIYAALLLRASGAAFHMPAMQASTTLMVPERHLARIAGLNQSIWGVAGIAFALGKSAAAAGGGSTSGLGAGGGAMSSGTLLKLRSNCIPEGES